MQCTRRSQWAGVPILLLLIGLAAGCATGPGPVASAGGGDAPAVLTGVTLLADGETPRLLLSGSGRLRPTVFARDGQTRFVIDLPDAVVSSGMEPPRADGIVLSTVEMRSGQRSCHDGSDMRSLGYHSPARRAKRGTLRPQLQPARARARAGTAGRRRGASP